MGEYTYTIITQSPLFHSYNETKVHAFDGINKTHCGIVLISTQWRKQEVNQGWIEMFIKQNQFCKKCLKKITLFDYSEMENEDDQDC